MFFLWPSNDLRIEKWPWKIRVWGELTTRSRKANLSNKENNLWRYSYDLLDKFIGNLLKFYMIQLHD